MADVKDAQGAVLDEIWGHLTEDSNLQDLFGGSVKLFPITAKKDPDKPYMVHELSGVDKDILRGDGVYYLDIYAKDDTAYDIWAINRRVKILLTETRFENSYVKFRIGDIDSFESLPTDRKNMYHYAGVWPLQYQKKELVEQILS